MADIKMKRIAEEVFVTEENVTKISSKEIDYLKSVASQNPRQRVRICMHHDVTNPLHEMLIIMKGDLYVQPHKHPNKSESFHIIEGRIKIVLFDDNGKPTETILMGDPASGRVFYYRLETETYHTVIVESDYVVFHETTNGPFDKDQTIYADWAPEDDGDPAEQFIFNESLPN